MNLKNLLIQRYPERLPTPSPQTARHIACQGAKILASKGPPPLVGRKALFFSCLRSAPKIPLLLQGILLFPLALLLHHLRREPLLPAMLGISGTAFALLFMPWLYRNFPEGSTEPEDTTLYSLRDLFSAKIALYGAIDCALTLLFGAVCHHFLSVGWLRYAAEFWGSFSCTAGMCFFVLFRSSRPESHVLIITALGAPAIRELVRLFPGGMLWLSRPSVMTTTIAASTAVLAIGIAYMLKTPHRMCASYETRRMTIC